MDQLVSQLQQEMASALAEVEEERKAVRADREALEAEKLAMSQLKHGTEDEIIELNVGGE